MILTIREGAKYIRRRRTTVESWIAEGSLKAYPTPKGKVIYSQDLDEIVKGRLHAPTERKSENRLEGIIA